MARTRVASHRRCVRSEPTLALTEPRAGNYGEASLPTMPPGGGVSADELLATRSAAASKLSTRPANATAGTQSPGRSYGVVRVAKRQ